MKGATQSCAPPGTKFYFVDLLGITRYVPVIAFEHFETYPCPMPIFPVPVPELPLGLPWCASAYWISNGIYPMDPETPNKARKGLTPWIDYVVEDRMFLRREYWHEKRDLFAYDNTTRFPHITYWRVDYPHVTMLFQAAKGAIVPKNSDEVRVTRMRRERLYDLLREGEGHKALWPITKDTVRRYSLEAYADVPETTPKTKPVPEPPTQQSRARLLL